MKSAKSKAKTPSLKHSYKKDQMDPSVVEASADADASPEIAFPAVSGEALPPLAEVTKAMLAKVRRAFGKAGKEASEWFARFGNLQVFEGFFAF